MKRILTIVMLGFILKAGAQTSVTPVSCSSGKFYVRVTFTDEYAPRHNVSSVSCPGGIFYNTEESQYLKCYMELFADAACIQPVPVDPRFFEYQNVITGSHGTRPDPSFMYIPDCGAPLPSTSEYKDNWRTDLYLVTKEQCNWDCSSSQYQCTTTGPGVPTNYNIIINCCFGPSALAVRLLEFTGVRNGTANTLHWKLEYAVDLVKLTMERSYDGTNYPTVLTTTDVNQVQWTEQTDRTSYYRLRIFNRDGSSFLSPVVVLKAGETGGLLVYPSPFRDILKVSVWATRNSGSVFSIIAADGRKVYRAERLLRRGTNQFIFFLPVLSPGLYMLQMVHADGIVTTKLLRQ